MITKMITKRVDTLFKGMVGIPDKLIEPLLEAGDGLRIVCVDGFMELSNFELINKRVAVSERHFTDKFGGPNYLLYYYAWKPTAIQTRLFEGVCL